MARVLTYAALFVATACAGPAASRAPTDIDRAIARWEASDPESASSVALRRETFPRASSAALREPPIAMPRGRVIDVRFEEASLAHALTMLADAANIGLVIGEGVEGTVSIDLRRVRPLDAMRALAEAHGVELALVGRTIVARRAGL